MFPKSRVTHARPGVVFADGVRVFVFADRVRFAAALRRLKDIAAPRRSKQNQGWGLSPPDGTF